ncbi:heparinase II/III family protein [Mariniphaga sp.]|uniref:heparinase II/III domain-containing protein n=1 Tax=Mariniphaga sp. TaxID=1954475 RepID=UPI0035664D5B
MKKLFLYVSTILKLGISNVAYVAWYRLTLKTGLRKLWFKQKKFKSKSAFFSETTLKSDYPEEWKAQLLEDANKIIQGEIRYYAFHWKVIGNPPNWFINPFNGKEYPNVSKHWTKLGDFNPMVGDIKSVWEASRFEWVVTLSRAYAVTGDKKYLNTLNLWLSDWVVKNPFNTGPNWKCGQEASIRVFNLFNAAYILNQYVHPSESLIEFVYSSMQRISKNILYAIAQDNNHGTSEAAALFMGGLWLQKVNPDKYPKAEKFALKGRYWLENRANKLISDSGSFSQHSVTYHRILLDTLCYVEFWRKILEGKIFSPRFYRKTKDAVNWLYKLTDTISGNAPNLGSNDGAMFLNTHSCHYRNFRPTLQLAAILFYDTFWFNFGKHNEVLYWFNMKFIEVKEAPIKNNFSANGFAILHGDNTWTLIRWPWFRFRPSHNDVMHVDIWHNGKNIICDSGSYSYNPEKECDFNLGSVHSHNTLSFDDREQMPAISRFLAGNWLKPETAVLETLEKTNASKWTGSYKDSFGNRHKRSVEITDNKWIIVDTLSGSFNKVLAGYTLNTSEWKLMDGKILTPFFDIELPVDTTAQLKDTFVSDHYQEKHSLKRIEIAINKPGIYTTCINLKD